jgi:hypothetical protein
MDGSEKKPGKSPARSIVSTLPMVYKVLPTGSIADRPVAEFRRMDALRLALQYTILRGGIHVEPGDRRPD